jgi:hypothetical protein
VWKNNKNKSSQFYQGTAKEAGLIVLSVSELQSHEYIELTGSRETKCGDKNDRLKLNEDAATRYQALMQSPILKDQTYFLLKNFN